MANQSISQRRSIRLYEYDYSQEGLYFVTICTQDKVCLFGEIVEEEMVLNDVGNMAKECWLAIPEHYHHVELHEFVIMPNHIHGIIGICAAVGANKHSPDNIQFSSPVKTIGSVIRGFKIGVMKRYKEYVMRANIYSPLRQTASIWQRNYYEHIIRNDDSYQKITEYICENPKHWQTDDYYN